MRILESIEIEVSQRPSRKIRRKVALERMMSYWFEEDKKASLKNLAASLRKMKLKEKKLTLVVHVHQLLIMIRSESVIRSFFVEWMNIMDSTNRMLLRQSKC